MSAPQSLDDQPKSDEKSALDEELEKLGADNEKIQILLEKFDQLQDEVIPEKLAKFKESIDEHQKIFEAKMKKGINKKIDDNAKIVTQNEKKMQKNAKDLEKNSKTIT